MTIKILEMFFLAQFGLYGKICIWVFRKDLIDILL